MEYVKNKKLNKLKDLFLTFLILCALYVNEDVMFFGTINNSALKKLRYVIQISVFLILLFYVVFMKGRIAFNNSVRIFCILTFFILCTMIANFDFRFGYVFLIMVYGIGVLFFQVTTMDRIMAVLYRSMVFICTFSVLLFACAILDFKFVKELPVITNDAGNKYYFAFLSNMPVSSGGFLRNYGPFREPGVFQMFIVLSLSYGLFRKRDTSLFRILIHFCAIATTFSTTGYIAMFLIVAAIFFDGRISKRLKKTLLFVFLIALIYALLFTDVLYKDGYGSVFGKLFAGNESSSFVARKASIFVNLKMFLLGPIFGKGVTFVENNFAEYCFSLYGYASQHNTNTICILFAVFGLFFGVIYVFLYCYFVRDYFKVGLTSYFCLMLSLIVILIGENLMYSILFSMFMFSAESTTGRSRLIDK